jgi:putative exosortase-associated protein (TIGR04073 family)
MKKFLAILVILTMAFSASAFAADPVKPAQAGSKLARGLTNIVTCWGEYFTQLTPATDKSPDYLTAFFFDILRGTAYTFRRAGVGLYDVVSFPFPGKTNYGPVIQPETVFSQTMEAVAN